MSALFTPPFLPLELLFNLLSLARRAPSARALHRQLRARQLFYGPEVGTLGGDTWSFGFWFNLAQAAALLDEAGRPTWFVPEWLEMPLEAQWRHLLEAWLSLPDSPRNREARNNLLIHLLHDEEISPTEARELTGLNALGIVQSTRLTPFGYHLLTGETLEAPSPQPWYRHGDWLWVPYPPHYALLWELEAYLDPVDPGVYALDARALRLACQRALNLGQDIVQTLPTLLARGMALSPEEADSQLADLTYALDDEPTLACLPGYLLTFSNAQELSHLRRISRLQPFLEGTLSAHHLFLASPHAAPVFNWLQAHKWLELPSVSQEETPQMPFTQNERAALLAMLLFAEGAHALTIPHGLFAKLSTTLPFPMQAAATRRAWHALANAFPRPRWVPEPEPPEMPETEILLKLNQAIQAQTPITFRYRKGQNRQPEIRHVTPLVVEQRGLRFYLLGYCHARRANRMFRIDRLQLDESS